MLSSESKRAIVAILAFLFLGSLIVVAYREASTERKPGERPRPVIPADSRECVDCHGKNTPGIVHQWEQSQHAEHGIGCLACHSAEPTDRDGFVHHGVRIATIVSPKDCARCHEKEAKQLQGSRHSEAADVAGSLDSFLDQTVQGSAGSALGCQACHGSTVKVLGNGKLDPATWPNGGIGRINPDGSKGSCAACHYRHDFSLAQSREADTCGHCHRGPSHPQMEIFGASKHGVQLSAHHSEMNLAAKPWVAGRDYSAAPSCATCHMSPTPTQAATHDTGTRLAWNLRPVVSIHQKDWQDKRDNMLDVCGQCHSEQWGNNYFTQFDRFIDLYNSKFAVPAQKLMDELYQAKLLTPTPFDEPIEFIFYELWHHEGRRARSGAAMMGPDFVQWQGTYELAKTFYNKLLPEAERLKPGITAPLLRDQAHLWRSGVAPEVLKGQAEFYQKRYSAPPSESH